VFACACALASGLYMTKDVKYADETLLVKQKALLQALLHVHQNEVFGKAFEKAKTFKLIEWKDRFTKPEVFDEFYRMWEHGMLPMNEVFSIMNAEHREEVISFCRMVFFARDWETLYNFLRWARFHINEGMFIYGTVFAAKHHKDLVGVVVPAPYEIYPYYFFNTEVIQRAQLAKMQGFYNTKKIEDTITYIIAANYTGNYVRTNPEQKLSYFTEDIGLNSYYYNFHIDAPFWMGSEEYDLDVHRRGETYLYLYRQILSRYYLERLSNDLGDIKEISWHEPIETGYYPALRYYNGDFFPSRDNNYDIHHEVNYYDIDILEDSERHIRDSLEYAYIVLPEGKYVDLTKPESVEYLGNFIQGNPDNKLERLHGFLELAKNLLGASIDRFGEYKVIPSVLEHFETAMRDPVFYQLYKKLIRYYFIWQKHLPHYTTEQLNFKGVKIESVEMDHLVTYFEKFDAEITNAVDVEMLTDKTMTPMQKFGRISHHNGHDMIIKARQLRLNHLPFTFKLHVNSETARKVWVKVFIGPKYDELGHPYGFEDNRENMFELGHFDVELQAGKNIVTRNSEDFEWFVKDCTPYSELYKQVMLATNNEAKFTVDMTETYPRFPMRLMLPKGKRGGMLYQFFFMVVPHTETTEHHRYITKMPIGYPFDRPIDEKYWMTPNMFYYDVNIFHKTEVEINTPH
jgi:hypothetical protein